METRWLQGGWRCALVGAVLGCGSDAPAPAPGEALTVDTYNVGLAGAFIPFEPERRQAVLALVANMPSDVVCLQEVWTQADKDAIIAAARARFPHAVAFRHDADTPVPMTPSECPVAPEPTTAPCTSMRVRAAFEGVLSCLAQNCSTMPGSEMGQTSSTACARMRCIDRATALLTAGADSLRCYGCVAPNLPTETFATIRQTCTNSTRDGLAFRAQSGVMILSRHPIASQEVLVLPGTWNRRVIVRATVTLPGRSTVAVYCNHLTPIFEDVAFPYTGRYGCGDIGREGWENEQRTQIRRLMSWVGETSGGRPAIVLGDFNAGVALTEGGRTVLTAEGAANYELLRQWAPPAVPASYRAACTYCPENPLTGGAAPTWIDHIFLRGIPVSAVRSLQRTYTEATVTAMGMRVPPSDHYGLRAVITVPP